MYNSEHNIKHIRPSQYNMLKSHSAAFNSSRLSSRDLEAAESRTQPVRQKRHSPGSKDDQLTHNLRDKPQFKNRVKLTPSNGVPLVSQSIKSTAYIATTKRTSSAKPPQSTTQAKQLTSNNNPLRQRNTLNKLRPGILQRRAPAVLPLQSELVFRRELRHIWWPLSLGFVGAVLIFGILFGGRGGVVFVGGEAEG